MGLDGAELSCPGSSVVADAEGEAARFKITPTPETIGRDLHPSVRIQSLTQESDPDETPIKPDRTR